MKIDKRLRSSLLYPLRMQRGKKEKQTSDLLPLTPPVFHILLSLAGEDRHGYGIMLEVAKQTDGSLQLGPGTLYGCLQRMLAAGLVDESGERPDPELDDERRRYYRMTNFGRKVLRSEAQRLERAVSEARARDLLPKARYSWNA